MPTLKTSDERMLELMYLLLSLQLIRFQTDFCRVIGVKRTWIKKIRDGGNSFTAWHIERACKEYGVNANWVFGIETNIFRGQNNSRTVSIALRELRRSTLLTAQ